MARSRSSSAAGRRSVIQGKRCGSMTWSTVFLTLRASSRLRRNPAADSVVSARVLRSSSEIGGPAKYRKAVRTSFFRTISASVSESAAAMSPSRSMSASKTGTKARKNFEYCSSGSSRRSSRKIALACRASRCSSSGDHLGVEFMQLVQSRYRNPLDFARLELGQAAGVGPAHFNADCAG